MKITISKDYNDLSQKTADFISDYVKRKPASLLCFPSGESPTGTIKHLVQYAKEGKVDLSRCHFVGLDEWVGMDENDEGSCKHYLYMHLFNPLQISAEQIIMFNAKAGNLDEECKRMDDRLSELGPIDIMLVGIGMNGHIGLNEPGVPFDLYAHHIWLDEITKTVGQKYFKQPTILTEGITLGLRYFSEAKAAVLIASGEKKARIIAEALEGKVSNEVPASLLQQINNSIIFLDEAAASLLSSH